MLKWHLHQFHDILSVNGFAKRGATVRFSTSLVYPLNTHPRRNMILGL